MAGPVSTDRGRVLAYGAAAHHGDMADTKLNGLHGSLGARPPASPVVAVALAP